MTILFDRKQILLSSFGGRVFERRSRKRRWTDESASQLLFLPSILSREMGPTVSFFPPCRSLDLASGEGRGKERASCIRVTVGEGVHCT